MRAFTKCFLLSVSMLAIGSCIASASVMQVPKSVNAGEAFSIPTSGSGSATIYIVGPAQILRRTVELGSPVTFTESELSNAGHYSVVLSGGPESETAEMDVLPAKQPASLSFLAKPSRLPVHLQNGISGVAYIFDRFHNLFVAQSDVAFQLSVGEGAPQTRSVLARDGVAWVKMDSAATAGEARFQARVGSVTADRVIQQTPAAACNLRFSIQPSGARLELQTEPVRDCSGNALPDGTIVTFTSSYDGKTATVDVPLKRGIAKTSVPAQRGARISAASGVVMSNEARWGGL
jgi:hypothetical protein